MAKTIDEQIFEKMMHFGRKVRAERMKEFMHGEGGRFGSFGRGCGPMRGPAEGRPGEGFRGPEEGPGHGRGPFGHMGHRPPMAREMILNILSEHETGMRQKDLAERMRINPSSMSEMISRLEATGYVTRTVDPDDKRATLINLTELGSARANEMQDERAEHISKYFAKLEPAEKEELFKLLDKMMAE